jgi:putative transport protein
VWAIGHHLFRINPAMLMGGVAGARSHSGAAREAADEIGSSVPSIGVPRAVPAICRGLVGSPRRIPG